MSSPQNRREPRLRVQIPVTLSVGKKTHTTSTEDISYHGLYVPMEELPPLRQLVKVEIALRGGAETFAPHAMVVRHGDDYGKKGVGLEFFGRTESQAWDQFVRDAQNQPAAPSYPSTPPQQMPSQMPQQMPQMPPPQMPPQQQMPYGYGGAPAPGFAPPPHTPFAPPAPVIHGLSDAPPPAERKSAPPPMPAQPYSGANRRRHVRFPLPIEIRVRTQRAMHVAIGIDASLGGLSLCGADLALNIGEQVVLNLAQPGTPLSFRVEAVVRRTVPAPHPGTFGYGVEFANVDPARQTMLQDFFDAAATTLGIQAPRS